MENTARIWMLGAAAVIVSGVKLEDWRLAEKFAPEALVKKDENGEPVFRVMTARGTGSINRYGIVWGSYESEEGNATVTLIIDQDVGDRKAALLDVVGTGMRELAEIEKAMPGIVERIRKEQEEIGACIHCPDMAGKEE